MSNNENNTEDEYLGRDSSRNWKDSRGVSLRGARHDRCEMIGVCRTNDCECHLLFYFLLLFK